jgi:hypothetical protein
MAQHTVTLHLGADKTVSASHGILAGKLSVGDFVTFTTKDGSVFVEFQDCSPFSDEKNFKVLDSEPKEVTNVKTSYKFDCGIIDSNGQKFGWAAGKAGEGSTLPRPGGE